MKAAQNPAGRSKTRKTREPIRADQVASDISSNVLCELATALRSQALDIASDVFPEHSIYGVVIETGHEDRVTSLIALADGSASCYVSTGQGCLGCGSDVEVSRAAQKLVKRAVELQSHCVRTADRSQPSQNRVRVFLLSVSGLMFMDECIEFVTRPFTSQETSLAVLYADAQRLLQLIELRGAGHSLEHELATLVGA
jgi:hypothetical protein